MSKTAGVILAAGSSKRLGRPKQLLDWFGKTFIQQVIETASAAKLDPIVVVTGAYFEEVESSIAKSNVTIARNSKWKEGQSSSLIKGVGIVKDLSLNSLVVFLCDKPQTPVELVDQIYQASKDQNVDIVATSTKNVTCPPILFKSICFTELLKIKGDEGGRGILKNFRTRRIEWSDDRILLECDTEKNYEKLIISYFNKNACSH